MLNRITTHLIEGIKESVCHLVISSQKSLEKCHYIDVRIGINESKFASAEKGAPKESGEEAQMSFGVRVIAGDGLRSPGYFASHLGPSDLQKLEEVIKAGIQHAWKRALANASWKAEMKRALGELGESLSDTNLVRVEVHKDTFVLPFKEDPRNVLLECVIREAVFVSDLVEKRYDSNGYNAIHILTTLTRELFASSEGALIDQTYALTEGGVFITIGSEYNYDQLGAKCGWEAIYGKNPFNKAFRDFAEDLANETIELSKADVLPSSEKEVVVVTDPHYNSLLVHEIVGHPVEADRALKTETAYAGRSWLFRGFDKNQIGKRVASELVTAYSDTNLPGYGQCKYDAEGVRGKRVVHIDKGIFRGFLNSRETAAILGEEPNGAMRATYNYFIPLVRMTNTVFAPGDSNPEDIIREVDDGYYLVGHHTPSIGESRENFSISARRVYKIKNGELVKLYRSGGITSDSRDYLMNVDAVGNDFRLLPMPNCGKGTPLQLMRVGNGGPTMRSRARLRGGK
ncbi:MAG TPA: TldD/PmbA family protein [Thermodesulfobacteriota bacterium]|nr:TldD/PmbA family protein [Thermodesulfobacteriota bacterium]